MTRAFRILLLCGLAAFAALTACKKEEADREKSVELVRTRTLGLAYLEENKLEEAEQAFLKLVEMAPDEALGYANLGIVYLRMGRLTEAEQNLRKALKLTPDDPDIRLNLAEILEQDNRVPEAVELLEGTLKSHPQHVKSIYKLAQLYRTRTEPPNPVRAETLLAGVVELQPANVAARLQLIETLLRNGKTDAARQHLEALRQQMPELPKEASQFFDQAVTLAAAGNAREALSQAMIFHNFMKVTPLYQGSILELKGGGGPLQGTPLLTFSRDISIETRSPESILEALRFTDATEAAGLPVTPVRSAPSGNLEPNAVLAVADFDSDGDEDVYLSLWDAEAKRSQPFLFMNDFGRFEDIAASAGIGHPGQDLAAVFADYDNDGYLDLYVVNRQANRLYHNVELGKFRDEAARAGVADPSDGFRALFADFDHEGDLDLYLAHRGPNRLYRNNGDGTFVELAEKMGVAGKPVPSRDLAIGDFDEDGDLDLFVANAEGGNVLYSNLRQGRFEDVTAKVGLADPQRSGAVAAGDYNNDGFLDLFLAALEGGQHVLYRNKGDGTFERDPATKALAAALHGFAALQARFFDFDNDGFLDLLVGGVPKDGGNGLRLFHNDGRGGFREMKNLLPSDLGAVGQFTVADYNEDGDLDIFLTELHGGIRLLRNDGGNANKYLKVRLRGLRKGSGKNNYYGIGSKLEVRAGDLYQMRVITEPVTHLGLGQRLKADVVRIVWPNGVPQNLFYPGSDQDLVEEQTLKGSCAFVYAWNGEAFEFVTDVMWRSALGMPLGIMGGETAFASPQSSNDYFRIPGDRLRERDGRYVLQVTEELWETAYFDQVRLLAVDHPDSVNVYIDERFVPPPAPPLEIYTVTRERAPLSARDERGHDLLPVLRHKDHVYASNLVPGPYQGITEMHDLVLDLGPLPAGQPVRLFLQGWIFPTDASINVAISQSEKIRVVPPYLQVPDARGRWQTVVDYVGFPMGKDKTVVVDLTGRFLTNDFRVRIRTNMQIYWDRVFFSVGEVAAPVRVTELAPASADLHYRGFSRMYRKGGPHGPHWFDYGEVSREQKWRDLVGAYTRYGDVLPLLTESDSKFAIMNAGDEVTLVFDARQAPALPEGWRRDFFLYTDGWIKDGDLNTAHGKTVEPLPYHGLSRYPYGPGDRYPDDPEYRAYRAKYNTRWVTTKELRDRLKRGN